MNFKKLLGAAVSMVSLWGLAFPANALDDISNGKHLATQWCATCHLVKPEQTKASASAPPFMTLAKRTEEELLRLPTFLANPAHSKPGTQMPNFNLSRQEIGDLVAYIRSLKP
jgi:mono/diheme cytochrome c family protein